MMRNNISNHPLRRFLWWGGGLAVWVAATFVTYVLLVLGGR